VSCPFIRAACEGNECPAVALAPSHRFETQLISRSWLCRLVEEGGDWDRRNRLKAYQGLHLLSIRNFKKGGQLLLDTISTFTATELLDYDDFVVLCVLAGVLTLERKDLKKKVSCVVGAGANGVMVCGLTQRAGLGGADHRLAGSYLGHPEGAAAQGLCRVAVQVRILGLLPRPR